MNPENINKTDLERNYLFKILVGPFLYKQEQLIPSIVIIRENRFQEVICFDSLAVSAKEFIQAVTRDPALVVEQKNLFMPIATALQRDFKLDFPAELFPHSLQSRLNAMLSEIPKEQTLILALSGLLMLPGLIDIHTHFRTPGQEWKEDFSTGSRAALKGGITTIFDMPNNLQPIISQASLDQKKVLAAKSMCVNYGFYYGITDENVDTAQNITGNCGYKVFLGSSTGNLLITDWNRTLPVCYTLEKPLIIHAEDESQIQLNQQRAGKITPLDHPQIRNPQVAEAALLNIEKSLTDLPSEPRSAIIIAHISTRKEIEIIQRLQDNHFPVLSEVTLHHLLLNLQDFEKSSHLLKTNPPIRSKAESLALQHALQNGQITFTSSDHAPHTLKEKNSPQPPSGVPGMEYSLLLLFDLSVKAKISLETIINTCVLNPCSYFKLNESGKIKKDFFADCTFVNPIKQTKVDNKDIQSKAAFSPFHGWSLHGSIETTLVNGQIGFWEGNFLATQPRDLFPD